MGKGSFKITLPKLIMVTAFGTICLRLLTMFFTMNSCPGYGIIIDAGSSGSRIHIFNWKTNSFLSTLHEISKLKLYPGISSYKTGKEAGDSIVPLLHHGSTIIPPHCWSSTNIHLMATAGMRLVSETKSIEIFKGIRHTLQESPFQFESENAGILPGDKEAEYDWLSVNFATKAFVPSNNSPFVGVSDLGGASTQISFEVNEADRNKPGVKTIEMNAVQHSVYGVSRLHMGLYEAFRNTKKLQNSGESSFSTSSSSSPCNIPGDYKQCQLLVQRYVQKHAQEDMSQLGETAVAPTMKDPEMLFYGLDNFAKLNSIVFILNRNIKSRELPPEIFVNPDLNRWVDAAQRVCGMRSFRELRSIVPVKAAKDRILSSSCFGLIYVKALIEDVYKLQSKRLIFAHSIDDIDGSWATGASIAVFGNGKKR